jgi:hypothetical protein
MSSHAAKTIRSSASVATASGRLDQEVQRSYGYATQGWLECRRTVCGQRDYQSKILHRLSLWRYTANERHRLTDQPAVVSHS